MKPSKKFLSLPIISLQEGQQIGRVKGLILNAATKSLAAIIVDSKGFFKDQRIIPYAKVVSVGEDAITIDKETHVEKTSSLPELLELVKEKFTVIGTKAVTENGKALGIAEEYYVDPETGKIIQIEISSGKIEGFLNGKAWLSAEHIITMGHDVIIARKGSESALTITDKGLSESLKNFMQTTSHLASETSQSIGSYFHKGKPKAAVSALPDHPETDLSESETNQSPDPNAADEPTTKEPPG